ncbi:MAG: hypothetical protein R3174_01695 [Gammaproteobacteria bacterium]|nr:hypothetical protein [Gammaproteobacteria bacterium]
MPRSARIPLIGLLTLVLSACAGTGTGEPAPPCCYSGAYQLARVGDVYLALENGQRLAFDQAFPGYAPETGPFQTAFPFIEADISLVTYAALRPVLPQYDANGDGRIQQPELTVLYIREAALGLGHSVAHVGTNPRTDALVLPSAEASGLVRYVKSRMAQMTPEAQKVFRELVMVGQDLRLKGSEGRDREVGGQFTP